MPPCPGETEDAFLVADTQKSSSSCLAVFEGADSFEECLRFHYTEEDSARNLRAYITTLLGALHCLTDVQVVDGWGMLLKYVSFYQDIQIGDQQGPVLLGVTGFQAANSFLRTMRPMAPEMAFQLSNFKIAWTDKMMRQFTPPRPGEEKENVVYRLYLRQAPAEKNMSLLQWLKSHTVVRNKGKSLGSDKFLVAVKVLLVQNPIFFF